MSNDFNKRFQMLSQRKLVVVAALLTLGGATYGYLNTGGGKSGIATVRVDLTLTSKIGKTKTVKTSIIGVVSIA